MAPIASAASRSGSPTTSATTRTQAGRWKRCSLGCLVSARARSWDSADSPAFAVRATDLDRTWTAGADTPLVTGTAADLGWWLTGRGTGEGLDADGGVPELGPWPRRRPRH